MAIFETITDLHSLRGIEDWWRDNAKSIWAHPDYFKILINQNKDKVLPLVIVAKQDNQVISLLVARLEKRSIKSRFGKITISTPSRDVLTVSSGGILGDTSEFVIVGMLDTIKELLKTQKIQYVEFSKIKIDDALDIYIKNEGLPLTQTLKYKDEIHHAYKLPQNPAGVLAIRSKSTRKKLKYTARRAEMEIAGYRLEAWNGKRDLRKKLQEMENLAKKTYQRTTYGSGFKLTAHWGALIENFAEKDNFRAWFIYSENQLLAYCFGFCRGRSFDYFTPAYDPKYAKYSLGTILQWKMLEDLSRSRKVDNLDYGFGDAKYKNNWSTQVWKDRTIVWAGASPILIIFLNLHRITIAAHALAKGFATRFRVADKIRAALKK